MGARAVDGRHFGTFERYDVEMTSTPSKDAPIFSGSYPGSAMLRGWHEKYWQTSVLSINRQSFGEEVPHGELMKLPNPLGLHHSDLDTPVAT